MIRVLRIINRFNLGGPTYNAALLSAYLPKDEYETLLVGGDIDDSEESSFHITDNLGLKPIIIPEMTRDIDLKKDKIAYQKLKQIIREFKPDIVHTHASKAGTLGRLAASACGVKVIVHTFHGHVFHSYFGKAKTILFKNIERYLASKSTRIITISEKQKEEIGSIHKICSPDKIEIVPLGFDLSKFATNTDTKRKEFRSKYNLSDDTIAIGIIGRLVPIKDHDFFLEVVRNILHKSSKKLRFFIIGDGETRGSIEEKAKELNLDFQTEKDQDYSASLVFTSWIKDADWAIAGLDIIALTSKNEGTPVSLIEAQASSRPVVSTNVGGIENVVHNNVTGLLSPVGDLNLFTDNLNTLIDNDQKRFVFGSKAKENVIKKYHYQRLVNDVDYIYKKLLKEC